MIVLRVCHRLSARITQTACDKNKKGGRIFACSDCPGLDEVIDRVQFGVEEWVFLALEETWEAKKQEWLVELSGLKASKAVLITAQMVKSIEMLGY